MAVPLGAGIGIGLGIQDEVKGWYKVLLPTYEALSCADLCLCCLSACGPRMRLKHRLSTMNIPVSSCRQMMPLILPTMAMQTVTTCRPEVSTACRH